MCTAISSTCCGSSLAPLLRFGNLTEVKVQQQWHVQQQRPYCEIRNEQTAVDRTVSSTKILGLFVTKVPIDTWHN
jgi:hypothetical protein